MKRHDLGGRLALRAYPRGFRRQYGDEFVRAASDLRRHGGVSRSGLAARLLVDVARTAPRLRLEALMSRPVVRLAAVAALLSVGLMAAVVGSPMLVVLVGAVAGLLVLLARTGRAPLLPAGHVSHPLRWVAAGATAFGVGAGVLVLDGGELSSVSWTIWALSWAAATVLLCFGTVLAASRAVRPAR